MDDIEARLAALRAREQSETGSGPARRPPPQGLGLGMRVGVELVAGVMVGTGLGWGLDFLLGTKPWLMVLFLLLGSAAGVLNVYRVVRGMDETIGLGRAQREQAERSQGSKRG